MIHGFFSSVPILDILIFLFLGVGAKSESLSRGLPGRGLEEGQHADFSKLEGGLPQRKVHLRGQVLSLEIADEDHEHQKGLMFRRFLDGKSGMLFVFPSAQPRIFWMKNTFIPLDIGFFDSQMRLINFESMEPVRSESEEPKKNYLSKGPARYVIEVNRGWFHRHRVVKGDRFQFLD